MFDIIIENGIIYNGRNQEPYYADIGIKDKYIVEIGGLIDCECKLRIDAKWKMVTPGFIDPHCHSDALIMHPQKNPLRVLSGITTEIIGNCGISAAPVNERYINLLKEYCAPFFDNISLSYNWNNFDQYLTEIEKVNPVLNVGSMVGHGTIRLAVMGFGDREPTQNEMSKMEHLLQQSLDQGAFGMSSGLVYPPGVYSKNEELELLCNILQKNDALYATHMRNEGNLVIETVNESIRLAQQTGVNLQISHHKTSGVKNKGKSKKTLEMIRAANNEGLNVSCDVYPYTAASTQLSAILPPWSVSGGIEKLLERLKDKDARIRIKTDMMNPEADFENVVQYTTWDKIFISKSVNAIYEGKSIQQISEEEGASDCYEKALDILLETQCNTMMILYIMDQEDVSRIICDQHSMVCSDGFPSLGIYHPRYIGSFAQVLEHYAKNMELLSIQQAIHKMTAKAAAKYKIMNRGIIETGYFADILVIDFNSFRDKSTYINYDQVAEGIEKVIINGQLAVDNSKYNGICAGDVIKRNQ